MTDDQKLFLENFVEQRDTLAVEVGLLSQEKERLLSDNRELSSLNAGLQRNIEDMRANSAKIGFEESEKVSKARTEYTGLIAEITSLKTQKELLAKDIDEKNTTALNLGLMIKSIQQVVSATVQSIRDMSNDLKVFSNQAGESSRGVQLEAGRIKKFVDELANVIDKERKINHDRTLEIDARERAVIGREKMVEMQYRQATKTT